MRRLLALLGFRNGNGHGPIFQLNREAQDVVLEIQRRRCLRSPEEALAHCVRVTWEQVEVEIRVSTEGRTEGGSDGRRLDS